MTRVCPACHTMGPVRLAPDRLCASCEAQAAWQKIGDGERLVIDRDSIAAAVRRRAGEAAGESLWRRGLAWAMPVATLGAAAFAVFYLVEGLSARPIGPLTLLIAGLSDAARATTLAGAVSLVVGVIALVRLRRQRQFRRVAILACHLVAVVAGATAVLIGALSWPWFGDGAGHLSMPARESLATPSHIGRILDATVVVLAPDADGDARNLAMGTGAVIARDDTRAWIVTCSHVAMPYVAVGTYHNVRDASPLWVQLSDGREGRATVRWTAPPPLDVALVELPIDHPPEPVAIAADTSALVTDDDVTFVPNPYRSGWHVVRGKLLRRETHHTPAGTYDLLFTDLPVIHGDSGSGLYDARGLLVGLNTWTRTEGGGARGISLPSETMQVLAAAIRDGRIDRLDEAVRAPSRK